jgi:hypothetical protein
MIHNAQVQVGIVGASKRCLAVDRFASSHSSQHKLAVGEQTFDGRNVRHRRRSFGTTSLTASLTVDRFRDEH